MWFSHTLCSSFSFFDWQDLGSVGWGFGLDPAEGPRSCWGSWEKFRLAACQEPLQIHMDRVNFANMISVYQTSRNVQLSEFAGVCGGSGRCPLTCFQRLRVSLRPAPFSFPCAFSVVVFQNILWLSTALFCVRCWVLVWFVCIVLEWLSIWLLVRVSLHKVAPTHSAAVCVFDISAEIHSTFLHFRRK